MNILPLTFNFDGQAIGFGGGGILVGGGSGGRMREVYIRGLLDLLNRITSCQTMGGAKTKKNKYVSS